MKLTRRYTAFFVLINLSMIYLFSFGGFSYAENQSSDEKYKKEIVGERTLNSKTFLREDGLVEQLVYPQDVHFKNAENKLETIDNSLIETDYILRNQKNNLMCQFSKQADTNELVRINVNEYSMAWNYIGASSSQILDITEEMEENSDKILKNVNSTIKYSNIEDGVDLEYGIIGSVLKENIYIHNKLEEYEFDFELDIDKLEIINDEGILYLCDEKGNTVFEFGKKYMEDANGEYSDRVEIEVIDKNNDGEKLENPILRLIADKEWIENDDRVFPIKIDPVIRTSSDEDASDTYVSQANPQSDFCNSDVIKVGKTGAGNMFKSYLKADTILKDKFCPNDRIVSATMTLTVHQSSTLNQGSVLIGCYGVTKCPSYVGFNYNASNDTSITTHDSYPSSVVELTSTNAARGQEISFDVTYYFTGMKNTSFNTTGREYVGIMLKPYAVNSYPVNDNTQYHFNSLSMGSNRPLFTITYDHNGTIINDDDNVGQNSNCTSKANMITSRANFGSCATDNKIFALGGWNPQTYSHNKQLEVYNVNNNTWSSLSSMPIQSSYILNANVEYVNNRMYVVGGNIENQEVLKDVYEYNPYTNVWTKKATIPFDYQKLLTVGIGKKIYIFQSNKNAYVYDSVNDSFSEIEIQDKDNLLNAVNVNNEIYVLALHAGDCYYRKFDINKRVFEENGAILNCGGSQIRKYDIARTIGDKIYTVASNAKTKEIKVYDIISRQWSTEYFNISKYGAQIEVEKGGLYSLGGCNTNALNVLEYIKQKEYREIVLTTSPNKENEELKSEHFTDIG